MEHAWCRDPSRDERVRAAEDGRAGTLPTLKEAIVRAFGFDEASAQRACDEVKSWPEDVQKDCRFVLGNLLEQGVERLQALVEAWRYGKGLLAARYPEMIPKSVSASSPVDQENKGDGMRTERVTLEVTHDSHLSLRDWPSLRTFFGESVRVVRDEERDADVGAKCHASYEKAREKSQGKIDSLRNQILQARGERDAAIRERDAAVAESERRLRLCETMKRDGDSARFHAAVAQARVAELEAASGGGKGEPYMVTASGIPLYCSPPQPRGWLTGEEREVLQAAKTYIPGGCRPKGVIDDLLDRSTPPEVVLPTAFSTSLLGDRLLVEAQVKDALAAAGVEVADA